MMKEKERIPAHGLSFHHLVPFEPENTQLKDVYQRISLAAVQQTSEKSGFKPIHLSCCLDTLDDILDWIKSLENHFKLVILETGSKKVSYVKNALVKLKILLDIKSPHKMEFKFWIPPVRERVLDIQRYLQHFENQWSFPRLSFEVKQWLICHSHPKRLMDIHQWVWALKQRAIFEGKTFITKSFALHVLHHENDPLEIFLKSLWRIHRLDLLLGRYGYRNFISTVTALSLQECLKYCDGNWSRAAKLVKMPVSTLRDKWNGVCDKISLQ